MKNILLFFIFAISIVPHALAQCSVRISLSDNSPVLVDMDGRVYHKHGRSLTIGDLPSGKHRLKIYAYSPYKTRRGGSADLIAEDKFRIKDGEFLNIVADVRSGDLMISKDNADNNRYQQAPPPSANNNAGNTYNNNVPPAVPANLNGIISQAQVNHLQKKVNEKITDTEKLRLMKSSLANSRLSTAQVASMMTWLNFETSKVDFAKYTYNKVADPENYTSLENDLDYNSSKQELDNYIQKNKR